MSGQDTIEPHEGAVRGERGPLRAGAAYSMQSRASHVLAVGLMMAVGLSMLGWYYSKAIVRQNRTPQSGLAVSASRVQSEVPLLPLGPVNPPSPAAPPPAAPAPALMPPAAQPPAWLAGGPEVSGELPTAPSSSTPAQLSAERRLSGAVFSHESSVTDSAGSGAAAAAAATAAATGTAATTLGAPATDVLTTPVPVQRLPTRRLLLAKGAFIDCTLETAIDSTLPGMTTCITATDTFGADGKVVLLERGTKLIGETRGQLQQGATRLLVLWNEARTPTGVVVPLASPGADELGRAGLSGTVNRHFWERFGAAILISTINGAMQSAVQSSGRGAGAVVYSPTGSQDVLTEVLKSTINIPPTVIKQQGDRIQVLVARDLDFRSVYELRAILTPR